jgi:hypothetical protein
VTAASPPKFSDVVPLTANVIIIGVSLVSDIVVKIHHRCSRPAELSSRQDVPSSKSSPSKETSHGFDSYCTYFGAVVWRRRILGSP